MTSLKAPFVKGKIVWPCLLLQIAIISVLMFLLSRFIDSSPFLYSSILYAFAAQLLRRTLARDHRKGIQLIKEGQFEAAIPWFEKSVAYFKKNSWVDRYRCITLLSATGYNYREMGLCNLGFCYAQTGRGDEAKTYYQEVLKVSPNNGLALTSLNMLNSIKKV